MTKKVLIICYSHHYKEPRLLMQCAALKSDFKLTTAGFSAVNDNEVKFIKLTDKVESALFTFHKKYAAIIRLPFSLVNKIYMALMGYNASYSKGDFEALSKEKFDLIICHHPDTLVLAQALKARNKCKLIFNAHEIYPFEFENDQDWMKENHKRIDEVLKRHLMKVDCVLTVNEKISEFYSSRYNCKSIAIHNSKPYLDLKPTQIKNPIQIIHHGGAMPQRKLELMADAVLACNGKYKLTFMLINTNSEYLTELKLKYEAKGIQFIEPTSYQEIIKEINKYDIGIYILPNETINHELAMPNKLFEYIQARLALITSPNTTFKSLILKYGIGAVSQDYTANGMAEVLNKLTPEDITRYKSKAMQVAKELSSESDEKKIRDTVKNLILN